MTRRLLYSAVAIVALSPALHALDDAAAYKLARGPSAVHVKQLVLEDAKRGKSLQVRVQYPDGDGPFPVIVYSHGALGSKDNYLPLTEHWASHGYVTIQANHSDSFALGTRPGDPSTFRDWPSRPADVSFIIDSFDKIAQMEPALKGKLDAKHIGIGGHSFGANTAQLVGGAKATVPGGKTLADPRVAAVMMLSGQGPGEMLNERSWADFKKPLFVMSGTLDGPTRTGQPAQWRCKPYELAPPGDKFLVWVEGLDHGYGGITGVSFNPKNKPNPDHVAITKSITTAYWDAYLKADPAAKTYLASDGLAKFSQGSAKLSHK